MNLLLLSNSKSPGSPYLGHAIDAIAGIVGSRRTVCFVPFAAVTVSWDDFTAAVSAALAPLGLDIVGVHAGRTIEESEVVMVGGGNTFALLRQCRDRGLLDQIRSRVRDGMPYVGWSAGSNMACPTIRTTNDMPIVETGGFDALHLIDYQVNPHFTNELPAGHQGETREQRLAEYLVANPSMRVLGLPEGDWVRVDQGVHHLVGPKPAFWFQAGAAPVTLSAGPIPVP